MTRIQEFLTSIITVTAMVSITIAIVSGIGVIISKAVGATDVAAMFWTVAFPFTLSALASVLCFLFMLIKDELV